MRSIVCRFSSEAELLAHLTSSGDMTFLAHCTMGVGEKVSLNVMISNVREQCRLEMNVVERTAVSIDTGSDRPEHLFTYVVRPRGEDTVWLEAFLRKLDMMSRVALAA